MSLHVNVHFCNREGDDEQQGIIPTGSKVQVQWTLEELEGTD